MQRAPGYTWSGDVHTTKCSLGVHCSSIMMCRVVSSARELTLLPLRGSGLARPRSPVAGPKIFQRPRVTPTRHYPTASPRPQQALSLLQSLFAVTCLWAPTRNAAPHFRCQGVVLGSAEACMLHQYLTLTGVQSAGRLSMRRLAGSTTAIIPRTTHHSSNADNLTRISLASPAQTLSGPPPIGSLPQSSHLPLDVRLVSQHCPIDADSDTIVVVTSKLGYQKFAPNYDPPLAVMPAGICAGGISTRGTHLLNAACPNTPVRRYCLLPV